MPRQRRQGNLDERVVFRRERRVGEFTRCAKVVSAQVGQYDGRTQQRPDSSQHIHKRDRIGTVHSAACPHLRNREEYASAQHSAAYSCRHDLTRRPADTLYLQFVRIQSRLHSPHLAFAAVSRDTIGAAPSPRCQSAARLVLAIYDAPRS